MKSSRFLKLGLKDKGRSLGCLLLTLFGASARVLRISDPSKAKYQTEAALEEARKAKVLHVKWYNSKVVYAYNYIDGDDSIRGKR